LAATVRVVEVSASRPNTRHDSASHVIRVDTEPPKELSGQFRLGILGEVGADERDPADLLLGCGLQAVVAGHELGCTHAVSAAAYEIAAVLDWDAVAQPGDADARVCDVAHLGQLGVDEEELDDGSEDPGEKTFEIVSDGVPCIGMRGFDLVNGAAWRMRLRALDSSRAVISASIRVRRNSSGFAVTEPAYRAVEGHGRQSRPAR
jgi:hypothetical protein